LGGKVKRDEKNDSPSSSKGHQTWNLSRATKQDVSPLAINFGTFQGPPSWDFPSHPPFFLKARIWIIWVLFLDITFNLNI